MEEGDNAGFEDEGFYYHQRSRRDPKSQAQQQLRELEGKERLERSRLEHRLKLTQDVHQGTYNKILHMYSHMHVWSCTRHYRDFR